MEIIGVIMVYGKLNQHETLWVVLFFSLILFCFYFGSGVVELLMVVGSSQRESWVLGVWECIGQGV